MIFKTNVNDSAYRYGVIDVRNAELCANHGTTKDVFKAILFNSFEKASAEAYRKHHNDCPEDPLCGYFQVVKVEFSINVKSPYDGSGN